MRHIQCCLCADFHSCESMHCKKVAVQLGLCLDIVGPAGGRGGRGEGGVQGQEGETGFESLPASPHSPRVSTVWNLHDSAHSCSNITHCHVFTEMVFVQSATEDLPCPLLQLNMKVEAQFERQF